MVIALVSSRREQPSAVAVSLGSRLKGLREHVGKTQQELADALNLSNKTISAYETGRAALGSDDFPAWAQALGVSVPELVHWLGLGMPADPAEEDELRRLIGERLGPDQADLGVAIFEKMRGRPRHDLETVLNVVDVLLSGMSRKSNE